MIWSIKEKHKQHKRNHGMGNSTMDNNVQNSSTLVGSVRNGTTPVGGTVLMRAETSSVSPPLAPPTQTIGSHRGFTTVRFQDETENTSNTSRTFSFPGRKTNIIRSRSRSRSRNTTNGGDIIGIIENRSRRSRNNHPNSHIGTDTTNEEARNVTRRSILKRSRKNEYRNRQTNEQNEEQQQQVNMLRAASEIEQILRDNRGNANQLVDRMESEEDEDENDEDEEDGFNRLCHYDNDTSTASAIDTVTNTATTIHTETTATVMNSISFPTLTEHDVNAYNLFDSAGADEAQLRYRNRHDQLRRASDRNSSILSSTRQSSNSLSSSFSRYFGFDKTQSSRRSFSHHVPSEQQGVIYPAKYGIETPFFTPILFILTLLFMGLVIIRLMVSILTVTVGWWVVIGLSSRLMYQFWYRPISFLRRIHQRPILMLTGLGSLWGMTYICFTRIATFITMTSLTNLFKIQSMLERLMDEKENEIFQSFANSFEHDVVRSIPSASFALDDFTMKCYSEWNIDRNNFDIFNNLQAQTPSPSPSPSPSASIASVASALPSSLMRFTDFVLLPFKGEILAFDVLKHIHTMEAMNEPANNGISSWIVGMMSMEQDIILIKGLFHGLQYGIQLGVLWWCLFGSSHRPSTLCEWLDRHLWRFARRNYREWIRRRHQVQMIRSIQAAQERRRRRRRRYQQQQQQQQPPSVNEWKIRKRKDRPHCAICLEPFLSVSSHEDCQTGDDDDTDKGSSTATTTEDDEDGDDGDVSTLFQRHYLLCRHSFHYCCIQEWIEIKASCPICRIPLQNAIVNADRIEDTTTATMN